MPVAAFAAWVSTFAWSAMASYVFYAAAYVAATMAITVGLAKVSSALMGRPKLGAGMRSRSMTIRDSVHPRTILYGTGRTGGVLCYINTEGTHNQYLDFVVAVAGHEITSITDVWFDDEKITNAQIGGGSATGGKVTAGKYKNVAWIYKFLGTDTQAASSILGAAYHGEWGDGTHYGKGVAYVHIRLVRDADAYAQGPPGNFTFAFQGAKVYDPRLDSTNGGSGSHRLADPSTWAYSNNPALIAADYVIGGTITNSATRVPMRGFGAATTDVDWPSVIAAANLCDEDVTIPGSTTQNRYECNGALSMGDPLSDNLEQILTSMLGQVTYSSGKYRVFGGAFLTPATTLTESDLAGPIEYATGASRSVRYNAVKGTRYDTETGQQVEFVPRISVPYATADGGTTLYRDIDQPFVTDDYRAQRIAQIILRRSREQATLIWRGNLGCLRVGVWETVYVTVAELGLSAKVFRCTGREFKPGADNEAIVELTLREEFSTTYTDPLVADYGNLNPATPAAAPDDYVDTTGDMSVVFDPEFTFGTDGVPQYWDIDGNTVWNDGGTVTLTADGATSPQVRTLHLRTFMAQVTAGWVLSFTVRYRVSSALTGSNKRVYVKVYTSGETFADGATLCDSKAIDLTSATVGAWYTEQFSLNYAPDGTYDRVRVQVIVDKSDVTAGAVELDHCYGFRQSQTIDPGSVVQPITGYLTNEAVTLAADNAGTVASYATATGSFKVFEGVTEVTSLSSFAEVSETNCTGTINSSGVYAVTNMSANTAAYVVSATYGGVTLTKVFTLAKSLQGSGGTGPDGPPGPAALAMALSKYSVAVLAYANGGVPNYADAAGQITVWSGTSNVTGSCTFTSSTSGCTGSVNSSGAYSVTNVSGSSGTLTLNATYSGTTLSAQFVVTKTAIGYEIVSSLPATNLFDGRMVYLSTNGKMYRYVAGTGWTVAIDAADITTGKITAAQMLTNTITAASGVLAALSVQNANIVDLAVDTIKIANGAVTQSFVQETNLAGGSIVTPGNPNVALIPGSLVTVSGIPATNARVQIELMFTVDKRLNGAQSFYIYIVRGDGTRFPGPNVYLPSSITSRKQVNWTFIDNAPLAGTQTYQGAISTLNPDNIGAWNEVKVIASVLKR